MLVVTGDVVDPAAALAGCAFAFAIAWEGKYTKHSWIVVIKSTFCANFHDDNDAADDDDYSEYKGTEKRTFLFPNNFNTASSKINSKKKKRELLNILTF